MPIVTNLEHLQNVVWDLNLPPKKHGNPSALSFSFLFPLSGIGKCLAFGIFPTICTQSLMLRSSQIQVFGGQILNSDGERRLFPFDKNHDRCKTITFAGSEDARGFSPRFHGKAGPRYCFHARAFSLAAAAGEIEILPRELQ